MILAVTTHVTYYYISMILSIERYYFSKYHNRFVLVKEMDDVYCEVGTNFCMLLRQAPW
jgi:hypothetical protein